MPALVPERDRRSVSTSVLIAIAYYVTSKILLFIPRVWPSRHATQRARSEIFKLSLFRPDSEGHVTVLVRNGIRDTPGLTVT